MPRINLLRDHRDLEQPERVVERRIAHVHSAMRAIRLHQLGPGHVAGQRRDAETERAKDRRVAGFHPIGEAGAEIHERIPDRRHLPVENRAHA